MLVEAEVVTVLFGGEKRAIVLEYQPTTASHDPSTPHAETPRKTIKAKRQVVISCGALGTQQVLERSGIGSSELLDRLSIPVISDLPAVGENYQDHQRIVTPYKTSLEPGQTLDAFIRGGLDIQKAKQDHDPILGFNCLNFAGKVRPSEQELARSGPAVQEAWERDYKDQKSKPWVIIAELQA